MQQFGTKKQIHGDTLGEWLISHREALGLQLILLSQHTKIPLHYLEALETGRYDILPAGVYVRNFLKVLSEIYQMDGELLLGKYEQEIYAYQQRILKTQKRMDYRQLTQAHYSPDFWRKVQLSVLSLICLVYLGYQTYGITEPPLLEIYSPLDNFQTTQNAITVSGKTEAEVAVTINGESIYSDKEGKFEEVIYFTDGLHSLTIEAKKPYSRTNAKKIQFLVLRGDGSDENKKDALTHNSR